MTPYYKNVLKEIAKTNNFTIRSEERLDVLSDKFFYQVSTYGKLYCPCQTGRTEDTCCPCVYMRKHGACRCGLFLNPNTEGGDK